MATQAQITAVQQLYVSYLGRAADSAGLAFWSNAISTGTATVASVATGLTLANEYKTAYAGLTNDALVDKVYTNVLGRPADAAGKAFWVASFANGSVKADTFVASLISSLGTQDQQTINNKTFVAQTYTDTAGVNYNATAAAAVLVGVNNTAASVNTAITAITTGTLAGLVPAAGLISALASAQAAVPTFETTNKAAIDALVAKLAPIVTTSNATDALTAASTFSQKLVAAQTDANEARIAAGGGEADTSVLVTRAATAATELATARAALTTADRTNAAKYEAAVTAETAAKAAGATATDKAAVVAGLTADTTAAAGLTGTTSTDVYSDYVNGTAAQRTALDTAFKDSKYYATFKAIVAKDAAYADAIKATTAAKDVLDADVLANANVTVNGVTVTLAADGTAGSTEANAFVVKATAKASADALVTTAQAADANKVAVDALIKQYADVNKNVTTASDAINTFNNANTTVKAVAIAAVAADTAVKESFYFAAKPTGVISDDVAITNFGAGDSIVLGSNVTFNAGALSTGNNNASEFFLVKSDAGVQVVIENTVFGSAAVTANATTGTIASAADGVSVITLTGVTLDHVSVANGVVSYV